MEVSERACAVLKEILDSAEHAPGEILRLAPAPQGEFGLILDTRHEDDRVVTHDNVPVPVVDGSLSDRLSSIRLLINGSDSGPTLKLTD